MDTRAGATRPGHPRQRVPAHGVCLCAEISFDGKLLAAATDPKRKPGPRWWTRLLARKRSLPAAANTVRALFEAGRVDELCLRVSPCIDGRHSQPTLGGPAAESELFFARSITWNLVRMTTTADGDCLLHYRRVEG